MLGDTLVVEMCAGGGVKIHKGEAIVLLADLGVAARDQRDPE